MDYIVYVAKIQPYNSESLFYKLLYSVIYMGMHLYCNFTQDT